MSLKKILKIKNTLAFRLTLWYATIFTISSLGAFVILYVIISHVIEGRTDQELLNDIAELSYTLELKGDDSFRTQLRIEAESNGVEKIFLRLLDPMENEIAASNMSSWKGVVINKSALTRVISGEKHVIETLSIPGRPYKVRMIYGTAGPGKILQIGTSLEDDTRYLETFQEAFIPGMMMIMVLSAVMGWFMATRALSGVEEVTKTAVDISKGAFERRVQIKSQGDEILQLATSCVKKTCCRSVP